jgi:hypothetical protein
MQDAFQLLDYLVFVVPCPQCHFEQHVLFSKTAKGQEVNCTQCDYPFGFKITGDALSKLETEFENIQKVVRQKGFWIELSAYPPGDK